MKIAVYTCILPSTYAGLKAPYINNPDVPYWCITDEPKMVPPWNDYIITTDSKMTPRRNLQQYKMLPHKYLTEYDWVVWVDGGMRLKLDPVDIVNEVIESGKKIAFGVHPWRICSYEEGKVCAAFKSNSEEIINAQMKRYEEDGFPRDYGLAATTFFVRDNKDSDATRFFEIWHEETQRGSHRNQISWGFSAWKAEADILMWKVKWGDNRFYKK